MLQNIQTLAGKRGLRWSFSKAALTTSQKSNHTQKDKATDGRESKSWMQQSNISNDAKHMLFVLNAAQCSGGQSSREVRKTAEV